MKKVISIPLAFLLTAAMILFCISFIGYRIIAPGMNENGAAVSDSVINEELVIAREHITELSAIYGFNAETAISLIDRDTFSQLNRQASRWWKTVLQEGKAGEALSWDTDELYELLMSDAAQHTDGNWKEAASLAQEITEKIRECVYRIVLPVRQNVIGLGLKKIGQRIDLPDTISFFMCIPWTLLALSTLLAGLIVLIAGKKPRGALPYIGSALGGTALVLACLAAVYLSAGIPGMIREASQSLMIQYRTVELRSLLTVAAMASAMTAGCVLCMKTHRKGGRPK